MANKIIKNEEANVVQIRIDGAYTDNPTYMVAPYVKEKNGKEVSSYFGNFKFVRPDEARKTLEDGLRMLNCNDTIFAGQYPKWVKDNYGESLKVQNRVYFYDGFSTRQPVDSAVAKEHTLSIEVHIKVDEENNAYVYIPRAFVDGSRQPNANDALFEDDNPFGI